MQAEQIEIAPMIARRVENVVPTEGSLVEAGALLAKVDTDELSPVLDRAKAEVARARQTKAEAQSPVLQRQTEQRRAAHELERATA